jgi:Protein of unknown function (DUF2510)
MAAAPGWYDAGTPGRLRWWDGAEWTHYEADSPTSPTPAFTPTATGPAMGWYPVSSGGPVRWWDGSRWTALRMRGGLPKVDWIATEQPAVAFALGSLFLILAAAQLALGVFAHGIFFSGGGSLLLALLWILAGSHAVALRRIPAPVEAPVAPEAVQPLPGATEGEGAGWYPVTRRVSRWWTGTRWSQYAATELGVRPTFHGAGSYRALVGTAWVVTGLGAVFVVLGVVLLVVGADRENTANSLLTLLGVLGLIAGVPIGLAGAALLVVARLVTRRILLLPRNPPTTPVG